MNKEELYKKIKDDLAKKEIEQKKRHLEAWDNLKHFENPWDVPNIPQMPKDEYLAYYVPRLIKAGAIPKKDLIDGQIYIGDHRRTTIARWNAKDNKFEYWRDKFGYRFIDTCNHFEDDDGFALFVPIKLGTQEEFNRAKI